MVNRLSENQRCVEFDRWPQEDLVMFSALA